MKFPTIAVFAACCAMAGLFRLHAQEAQSVISPADTAQAVRDFNTTCAGCHGENAGGGDRAPALIDNPHLRTYIVASGSTLGRYTVFSLRKQF